MSRQRRRRRVSKKRGNGEGSIYRRKDGRWVGQHTVYTAKGPKYRYIYGKTRAAGAEKLPQALAARGSGLVSYAGKPTIGGELGKGVACSLRRTGPGGN